MTLMPKNLEKDLKRIFHQYHYQLQHFNFKTAIVMLFKNVKILLETLQRPKSYFVNHGGGGLKAWEGEEGLQILEELLEEKLF